MTPNVKSSEKIALVGVVNPQTVANTEVFSGVVDLGAYHQALGIALLGNMPSETIDFKCYRCDADGSNAVAVKSATQLAASASANDNRQILINLTADELMASGAEYIKFGLVTGGATGGPACVVALGVDSRFGPVTQATSVVEVKA
jgi:hypothetical protein